MSLGVDMRTFFSLLHRRPQSHTCQARGCQETTSEGKPFCSEHVDRCPHAAVVLAELEEIKAEAARLARGRVTRHGRIWQEVELALAVSARSVARLAKDLHLEGVGTNEIALLLRVMQRHRVVTLTGTGRQGPIYELAA